MKCEGVTVPCSTVPDSSSLCQGYTTLYPFSYTNEIHFMQRINCSGRKSVLHMFYGFPEYSGLAII